MIEVLEMEQGSEEWLRARMGIPTASEFATVMAKGRDGGASKTRRTYMFKLAGELVTGEPMDSYSNNHMERGKDMEAEARDLYAFMQDTEPQLVGFVRNGQKGCSPDSLIAKDGMVEIKTKLAHLQIECLLSGGLPPEHKAQCQGSLWVAEREWIDFVSYWPKLPLHVHRIYRDEEYISDLAAAVEIFSNELAGTVERIKQLGGASPLRDQLSASLEAA